MKLLLLFAIVALGYSQHITYSEEDEYQWELFKIAYERVYRDEKEEQTRKEIFMKNLNFFREHNKKYERGEVTFTVGVNQFADMTNDEFSKTMNKSRLPKDYKKSGDKFEFDEDLKLPQNVDWRKQGAVTPVKDQGLCGACWAFSAIGSLEGLTYLKTKKLVSLSEQNLVDCSWLQGNTGCEGGNTDAAFRYIKENQGIDTEASYPYTGKIKQDCRYNAKNKGASCSGHVDVCGKEKALKQAVAKIGPISVSVDARFPAFQHYTGGLLHDPNCTTYHMSHDVLAVGYGTDKQGRDYWLVKNSWGTKWGLNGYLIMPRNYKHHMGMCGIATHAIYPKV
ncbi:procathepsin L-like [Macrosteles quadrilineatus]|uniref:procathepsin L-like n=1 Tax=Macrosteles quadrilineatus TaxID=74068 RepID=UPI0023E22000|nr:procathepsin L-like [Macrosteles quadrilineatus]